MARKPKKAPKPPVTFSPAPAVEQIANQLIVDYHQHLRDHDVRIEYIFRSESIRQNGRVVIGQAKKVTSLAAFFGREDREAHEPIKPFFCLVIGLPTWNSLSPETRAAGVDHLLCHLSASYDGNGNTKLGLEQHDFEDFNAVVQRHGLWQQNLCRAAKYMAPHIQPELDMEETAR